MHSKRRYKNLYLSGHPRGTWVFSKLQGLQYYFPQKIYLARSRWSLIVFEIIFCFSRSRFVDTNQVAMMRIYAFLPEIESSKTREKKDLTTGNSWLVNPRFARVCKLNNQIHSCLARFSILVYSFRLGHERSHSGLIAAKEKLKFQIPFCKINRFK